MAALDPGPSPSRNPFARPNSTPQSGSFSKSTILPSPSHKRPTLTPIVNDVDKRLGDGIMATSSDKKVISTNGTPKSNWRLLWRGGLELGKEGWRLEGITFFALLSFSAPTPTATPFNPFSFPTPPPSFSPVPSSPFHSLPGGTVDICLSLESMKGRKFLQVRGLVPLPEDELLEGEGEEDGTGEVQVAIAPEAYLLVAYFTGLLCREGKLSNNGRTLCAVVIGLGDEEVDATPKSTILIYGQLRNQSTTSSDEDKTRQGALRLLVGRKRLPRPPVNEKRIRPGEPLPRGGATPLFLPPENKKPFRPFARTLSRSSSTSIYAPPPSASAVVPLSTPGPAPISGRTPGRRGEKRARQNGNDEQRKRRTGKITGVPEKIDLPFDVADQSKEDGERRERSAVPSERFRRAASTSQMSTVASEGLPGEEDIFGLRAASIAPSMSRVPSAGGRSSVAGDKVVEGEDNFEEIAGVGKAKRARVPQQVLDNKASIRKQTLLLLEERGVSRTNDLFKEIFGITTKGVYFAFRNRLDEATLSKPDIHRIILGHLDMYLPTSPSRQTHLEKMIFEEDEKSSPESAGREASISGEQSLYLHGYYDGRVKLEPVAE
ncbi:hypothetical protein I307_03582 [Cryptococcus deuterogattii 99/473]|uniref:Sld7 C-terminal domain-containing protein n=1 Tax=Cryptococcus deuterogattii Ram5 TaxID=1296110 RepID=A0A0D0TBA9_9TREE|nr:hypothetical protein I313_00179 [Cryptococcus deuterogattii Ram5]KIY56845.1 hypothetical protein I307_03582 [Cryptococcus deuterogattii 99/473]